MFRPCSTSAEVIGIHWYQAILVACSQRVATLCLQDMPPDHVPQFLKTWAAEMMKSCRSHEKT